jgi:hypothetical protein
VRRGVFAFLIVALLAFAPAAAAARPATVALDYLRGHPESFRLDEGDIDGLKVADSYRSGSGAVHLRFEQFYRGVPVFGPGVHANLGRDGELINIGGAAQPDPQVDSIDPRLPAPDGDRPTLTIFRDRLAWRVIKTEDPTHVYDTVVDATTGRTLYRTNLVREAADDALVFRNYPGAPLGGTQTTVSLTGWLSENPRTRLFGPNAWVYGDPEDAIDGVGVDPAPAPGDEIAPGAAPAPTGEWTYPHTTQPAGAPGQHCPSAGCSWSNFDNTKSWTENRNQAGTQLFYYVNAFHDHLRDTAAIGFNSASGNFEGADRVQAQVDDGSTTDSGTFDLFPDCDHINNAYVLPVPDGAPFFMQVFLWSNACTTLQFASNDVNAADDALIVYHEYTHGMTNRLVTDGAGFPAMNGWQPGAMDEGTADWFALDLLNAQGLQPDTAAPGELRAGTYENDALRTQPYDCPVGASASACPGTGSVGSGGYTYGDFARILGGPEVHADGEIWVETLWDLRARLIATYGSSVGITRTRALVTDGLRLAPPNPTFLDMRNAILQANANRGFGDQDRIWSVFAARGMGFRATTTSANDTAPRQDFSLPSQQLQPPPPPPVDNTRPRITGVKISRKRVRAGQSITFTFRLSKASTATISIDKGSAGRRVGKRCRPPKRSLRKRPRCTRYSHVGTLTRKNLLPGTKRVRFSGRFRSRALKPGSYRATIVATDPGGKRSRAASVTFRVTRR